jgi:hypothetical protein
MGKLIGSEIAEGRRLLEPDYSAKRPNPFDPANRNPWDPRRHPRNHRYIANLIKKVDKLNIRPAKYPPEVRAEVYRLRDKGLTLREIATKVKISKSTACLYLQNRKSIPKTTFEISQPGSSKIVERDVTIREVSLGKIKPFKSGKLNDQHK